MVVGQPCVSVSNAVQVLAKWKRFGQLEDENCRIRTYAPPELSDPAITKIRFTDIFNYRI